MKKILAILVLTLSMKATSAQTGVPDTLAYLNSITANKAFFIGKTFSVLADSLKQKLAIKYFSPSAYFHYNATWETSTSFSFYYPQTDEDFYLTYPKLRISWQPYLDMNQANLLFYQTGGSWLPTVTAHYAAGIIADIKVREE